MGPKQTRIGDAIVSVNPYKKLPIYTDSNVDLYKGTSTYENPPHM